MRYFNVMILGPSQSPYEGGALFGLNLEDWNNLIVVVFAGFEVLKHNGCPVYIA